MKGLLVLLSCALLCFCTACENTPPKEESPATKENSSIDRVEAAPEKTTSSIKSDIQFIRDKYAIINKGTNYKTVPIDLTCDEWTSVKLERKYNEAGVLSFLQFIICGEHGCFTKNHYYWEGELIFLYDQNDFTPGSSHIIEEHRTYFKDGEMILCLEKRAQVNDGKGGMSELLEKAVNKEVACTEDKRTEKLAELENLSVVKAKSFFCASE